MLQITQTRPTTKVNMAKVVGFNTAKISSYGYQLMAAIVKFCVEENIETHWFPRAEVESELKVTVTVQTSFGPITKFIKVDEEVMEVVNKNDERIHLPLSKISPRIDPKDSRLKKTILCLVEKGVSALASALNVLVNKFHDESCKKEVSTSLTESVEDSSTRPSSPAMGTSSWRQ